MLKRLRIAVLLYALLFVAAAQFFMARHTTDWDAPLWVDIYTVAGDAAPATRAFVDGLSANEFADAEAFLAREARRYGVSLEQPFKLRIVGEIVRFWMNEGSVRGKKNSCVRTMWKPDQYRDS